MDVADNASAERVKLAIETELSPYSSQEDRKAACEVILYFSPSLKRCCYETWSLTKVGLSPLLLLSPCLVCSYKQQKFMSEEVDA